jgi:hypothetical protein
MRRLAAALVLASAALLAGCATTGSGSGGATTPPPATTPATTAPAPSTDPTSGAVTVDGVVEKGVEPGCLVLKTGSQNYLLQGAQASSAPLAVPVRVTGQVRADLLSYCQQGTPLEVAAVIRR